jgi:hypothetical protein
VEARILRKQSLQYTGLPWVGRKGTVVSIAHIAHLTETSTRSLGAA